MPNQKPSASKGPSREVAANRRRANREPAKNTQRTSGEPSANRKETGSKAEASQKHVASAMPCQPRSLSRQPAANQPHLRTAPNKTKTRTSHGQPRPKNAPRRNTEQLRSKLGTRSEPDEPDAATANPTGTRSRPTASRKPALNNLGTNREPTANQPQNRPEPTANQLRTSCAPAANHRHIWSLEVSLGNMLQTG